MAQDRSSSPVPPVEDGNICAGRLRDLARSAIPQELAAAPGEADRGRAYSAALAAATAASAAGIAPQEPAATAARRARDDPREAVCAALGASGIDSAPAAAAGELANALAASDDDEDKQAERAASRAQEWREKFAREEWKRPASEKSQLLQNLRDVLAAGRDCGEEKLRAEVRDLRSANPSLLKQLDFVDFFARSGLPEWLDNGDRAGINGVALTWLHFAEQAAEVKASEPLRDFLEAKSDLYDAHNDFPHNARNKPVAPARAAVPGPNSEGRQKQADKRGSECQTHETGNSGPDGDGGMKIVGDISFHIVQRSKAWQAQEDRLREEVRDLGLTTPLTENSGLREFAENRDATALNNRVFWWLDAVKKNGAQPSDPLRQFLREEANRNDFQREEDADRAALDGKRYSGSDLADLRKKVEKWECVREEQREKGDAECADRADNMAKRWRSLIRRLPMPMGGDPQTPATGADLIRLAEKRGKIAAATPSGEFPPRLKKEWEKRPGLLALGLSLYLNGTAPREDVKIPGVTFSAESGIYQVRVKRNRAYAFHKRGAGDWDFFGDFFDVMGKVIGRDSKHDFRATAAAGSALIKHFRSIRSDSLAGVEEWNAEAAAAARADKTAKSPAPLPTIHGGLALIRALNEDVVGRVGVTVGWLLLRAIPPERNAENAIAGMSYSELVANARFPRSARYIFPQLRDAGLLERLQGVRRWGEWTECVEAVMQWAATTGDTGRFAALRAALGHWWNSLQNNKKSTRTLLCNQKHHSVKMLAEFAGCHRDTTSKIGKRMEQAGILTRNRGLNDEDKRCAGYQLYEKIRATAGAIYCWMLGKRKKSAGNPPPSSQCRRRRRRQPRRRRPRRARRWRTDAFR